MVSRITEIQTDDGDITLGDVIRFLLKSPEFKRIAEIEGAQDRILSLINNLSRAVNETGAELKEHSHLADELRGIEAYLKKSELQEQLDTAINDLEQKINIDAIKQQIGAIPRTDTLEKRIAILEKKRPQEVINNHKTVVQQIDDKRLAKMEAAQKEITGLIDEVIQKAESELKGVKKSIWGDVDEKLGEIRKGYDKLSKRVNIIGGVNLGTKLKLLKDVNVEGIVDGQGITWNASSEKFNAADIYTEAQLNAYRIESDDYTVSSTDRAIEVIVANKTTTLPAATEIGREITIINSSDGDHTVTSPSIIGNEGSETTRTMRRGDAIVFKANGAAWRTK